MDRKEFLKTLGLVTAVGYIKEVKQKEIVFESKIINKNGIF